MDELMFTFNQKNKLKELIGLKIYHWYINLSGLFFIFHVIDVSSLDICSGKIGLFFTPQFALSEFPKRNSVTGFLRELSLF